MAITKPHKKQDTRLKDLARVTLLYDFYGPLLPETQRKAIENCFLEDWSLSELAKLQKVSRQAIFDALHHGIDALEDCERKLELVTKMTQIQKMHHTELTTIYDALKALPTSESNAHQEKYQQQLNVILEKIQELIQENQRTIVPNV